MYILTHENKSLDTSRIPDCVDALHYCVLDYSDSDNVDYQFPPVVFLETYPKAAFVLQIGKNQIQVPFDWSVLLGDLNSSELELLPLKEFRGRSYSAFVFNPCTGYIPSFLNVEIVNIYQEIHWSVPTLKSEHMLAIPLCGGSNPPCVFFVDIKNKVPDVIDIQKMF